MEDEGKNRSLPVISESPRAGYLRSGFLAPLVENENLKIRKLGKVPSCHAGPGKGAEDLKRFEVSRGLRWNLNYISGPSSGRPGRVSVGVLRQRGGTRRASGPS